MEDLFRIANMSVLPGWLLLFVAPRWKWTQRYCTLFVPLALGLFYAWLLRDGLGDGDFGSLAGVMKLFAMPQAAFAGWVHYLIFDLFIGAWEARDAQRLGISRWLVLPCQFMTLMLGPIGLALYLLMRGGLRKQWEVGV
jgi:hypothetical protein